MEVTRHTELEWQFAAPDLEPARHWLAAQPKDSTERRFAPQPTLTMQDTYYDSSDWMIFRAGYALRVRRACAADTAGADAETEITLKSLNPSHDGLAKRTELSESVGSANLEEVLARSNGIGQRIRELVGARPLGALFHAHTRRERQQLLEADTELPLAEVDLDETSIQTPAGQAQELRRVEVECINAEPGALSPWVESLCDAAHLQPLAVSKFRAGLQAAGLDPAAQQESGVKPIQPSQSFAETQLTVLQRYFASAMDREAAVRAGSATAVHEMRVAIRHLEVLLRMFRGLGPGWAMSSRHRIRALVDALGAARDCDVQAAFLDSSLAGQAGAERKALEPMRERLALQHAEARARLLKMLDSPGVQHWVQEWRQHLHDATPGSARAQHAATAVVARDLIRSAARSLRKHARRLDDSSGADAYHEVRIRAKRLRYTLDAFAGLYGGVAGTYSRGLAQLQNVLGQYHDSTVREKRFAELAAGSPRLPPATTFMIGRLVERDSRALERCRKKFPKAYRRTTRRRWRELTDVMKSVEDSAAPVSENNPTP